jgi:hypothetical protein
MSFSWEDVGSDSRTKLKKYLNNASYRSWEDGVMRVRGEGQFSDITT